MKKIRSVCALLLAGCVFLFGGWTFGRVRQGVVVDGVPVGGLAFKEAERAVREEIARTLSPFTVHTPDGDVYFRTQFTDDLGDLLRRAQRGEELRASVKRVWGDMEEELLALCTSVARPAADATLTFSSRGFEYIHESAGRGCEYDALLREVSEAFEAGREEVTLHTFEVSPAVTEALLRARTRPLASYTTYFDASNSPRAHNIALAASRISGTVLLPGEEFSFNRVVGKRTAANGFETANIISGGEFVPGVGYCYAT